MGLSVNSERTFTLVVENGLREDESKKVMVTRSSLKWKGNGVASVWRWPPNMRMRINQSVNFTRSRQPKLRSFDPLSNDLLKTPTASQQNNQRNVSIDKLDNWVKIMVNKTTGSYMSVVVRRLKTTNKNEEHETHPKGGPKWLMLSNALVNKWNL